MAAPEPHAAQQLPGDRLRAASPIQSQAQAMTDRPGRPGHHVTPPNMDNRWLTASERVTNSLRGSGATPTGCACAHPLEDRRAAMRTITERPVRIARSVAGRFITVGSPSKRISDSIRGLGATPSGCTRTHPQEENDVKHEAAPVNRTVPRIR